MEFRLWVVLLMNLFLTTCFQAKNSAYFLYASAERTLRPYCCTSLYSVNSWKRAMGADIDCSESRRTVKMFWNNVDMVFYNIDKFKRQESKIYPNVSQYNCVNKNVISFETNADILILIHGINSFLISYLPNIGNLITSLGNTYFFQGGSFFKLASSFREWLSIRVWLGHTKVHQQPAYQNG